MQFQLPNTSHARILTFIAFLAFLNLLLGLAYLWTSHENVVGNLEIKRMVKQSSLQLVEEPQRLQREHLLAVESDYNARKDNEKLSSRSNTTISKHKNTMTFEKTHSDFIKYDTNSAEEDSLLSDAEANRNFGINFKESYGMFDGWRRFKTHAFIVPSDNWNTLTKRKVCLATQTSVDRIHWLVKTTQSWSGPVSIAVFIPDMEFAIAKKYIEYLRNCFPSIRKQVSFHFTYPVDHPPTGSVNISEIVGQISCDDPTEVLVKLVDLRSSSMMQWREQLDYPQNLLRNVARTGCQSQFVFTPDIDMIPIPKMDTDLEEFLSRSRQQECDKCAYVIPVYEISTTATHMPQNKTELLRFIKEKKARQFHITIYTINQKSSNLSIWQKLPQSTNLDVAYNVTKYIFKYEPLYVAKADVPLFDERFIGFGMTRNTQVYEMYVMGYNFKVLNNVFTNHWGFQDLKTRPRWRATQQEINNAKFDNFAKEISARYDKDPYNMLGKLKKMNLKNMKVVWNKAKSNTKESKHPSINGSQTHV